ncbi:MAG: ribonucleoside-diphosphate reductase subunit alpha, partial [Candidatus Dormibacteraceae bacterium]
LGLWSVELLERLKYLDGSVQDLSELPDELRAKYKEAFEIDPLAMLRLTAARAKWIDQSQSHNVFLRGAVGRVLDETYRAAWRMGLKTTYYLRSLAASQVEKSTLDTKYGLTQKRNYELTEAAPQPPEPIPQAAGVACGLDGEECEVCQ